VSSYGDLAKLAARFEQAVHPTRLECFATSLGLTTAGLQRLGVGWAEGSSAWAFPMSGGDGRVIGIRLRTIGGCKFSVRGGHEGLFVPADLDASRLLLIAEGPTDTCALLDLGFEAVGRPSCRGGLALLLDVVRSARPSKTVVVADADEPGQEGARDLACRLAFICPRVAVLTPPAGIKDARAWKNAGATHEVLRREIESASAKSVPIRVTVLASTPARARRRRGI